MKTNRCLFTMIHKMGLPHREGRSREKDSNRNFKLLLIQIFCRRLNIDQGIVSMRVGLPYDLLRFSPRSTICYIHPLLCDSFC